MNKITIQQCAFAILMAAACLGAASCAEDTGLESSNGKGDMTFSAQVGETTTRVTEDKWDGDEKIGVKSGDTVKTYQVATDGTMTTEETPFQWEGTSYDLLAWTPYTTEQIDLTDQTTEAKMFDCDLLISRTTAQSKNVHFTFSHLMTRMWWELQVYEGYTTEEVNAATVSFLGYGAVTYSEGVITTVGDPDQQIDTYNTRGEYYRDGEAMMVPCSMWEKPLIQVEIGGDTYTYTPSKSNSNDVIKNTGELLAGTWQRYYLSVSKQGLVVDMESASIGWEEEAVDVVDALFKVTIPEEISSLSGYSVSGLSGNFISNAAAGFSITYTENNSSGGIAYDGTCERSRTTGSDNIVTFTFTNIQSDITLSYTNEYMEVGYYFYNDGTCGADYKDSGTVGVVFKIGAHDTDAISNYSGTDITEIHGYVVALADEAGDYAWKSGSAALYGSSYPEYGNIGDGKASLYIGYSNTQYLITTAAAGDGTTVPAASASTTKNQTDNVAGTSGWYLPSYAQLKDLESLSDLTLNSNYSALSGTYWSSSFDSDPNAYIVIYSAGAVSSTDFYRDVTSTQKVRLILTF